MGLEKNKIIDAAFVNLSKAFDSVCHVTLLEKLSLYGFRGGSLRWFRSYLQGRKQRVAYGGEVSGWSDVCFDVPQGSILGPLLFCIFVNDLPAALPNFEVMMYADGTTVYFGDTNATTVQEVLNEGLGLLSAWISRNNLKLNVNKKQVMMLSRRGHEREAEKVQLSIDNEVIAKCDEVKYLGVIVDKKLK